MRKRKAQGEIITTVLIILLVLAAIVIVWQVVRGTVSTTATRAGNVANCIDADITLNSATLVGGGSGTASAVISKAGNDVSITSIKVLVYDQSTGAIMCSADDAAHIPAKFASGTSAIPCTTLTAGTTYTVKVAPMLGTSNQCEPMGGSLNVAAQ
ncbi:MAG: hypothetical protein WC867_04430 [Candidatus Pacearchaeota archaeon]|jgi:hypothetical protein